MNKSDFMQQLIDRLGSKREAQAAFDAFMATLKRGLSDNGSVTLPNFGKFTIVQRKARAGRNPKTGESIQIPAKKALAFHPAKNITAEINS